MNGPPPPLPSSGAAAVPETAEGGSGAATLERLRASIGRGLDFLHRSQLPSGEFRTFMSTDHALERDCVVDSSPFPTALIAYSLGFADCDRARAMLERAVRFFLAEMEGPGVWRYWTKRHRHHAAIPPDLDDTACVSYVLRREGAAFPSNRGLLLANRDRRGLFYTWLAPRWPPPPSLGFWRVALRLNPVKLFAFWRLNESEPDDVDCVVNANVLLYLGESEATRAVADYLIGVLRAGREECCDKWHLNRFMFHYAVARAFHAGATALGTVRDEAVGRIVAGARPDGAIGATELDTALAVCALLSWRSAPPELERAVRFLLDRQRPAGDWPRTALYYGGPKKYYGWGSEELTTGFCLEALLRYRLARPDADSGATPP